MSSAAACGSDDESMEGSSESGTTTDSSGTSNSTSLGMTSTVSSGTSTGTGDTGTNTSDATSLGEDGSNDTAAASDSLELESSGSSGASDPSSSATSAESSTESGDDWTESGDSSTESQTSSDTESAPLCDGVAACNDHGSCIEQVGGLLCECEVDDLPTCELPLVREIGTSGTSRELILVNISADGRSIVGSHAPPGTPEEEPSVAVLWTLERGLETLELDPRGDNVAWNVTADRRVVTGRVQVGDGHDDWVEVVWRDGVLEPRDPDEEFDFGGEKPPTPLAEDVETMLDDLGIVHWPIEHVNGISADGKVMFWLGRGPDRWKRWQLRLP